MGGITSGRQTQISIGAESAWGAAAAASKILKHTGFSGGLKKEFTQSKSRLGNRAEIGSIHVAEMASYSIPVELDFDNLGAFAKAVLGSETVEAVTGGAKHIIKMLNNSYLPSYSLQLEYGSVRVAKAVGAVASGLSIEISPKSIVTASLDVSAKTETDLAITLVPGDITIGSELITKTGHGLINGDRVRFLTPALGSVLPAPLSDAIDYYVVGVSGASFSVSLTEGGSAVDLTSTGTGTFSLAPVVRTALSADADIPLVFAIGEIYIDGVASGEITSASVKIDNGVNTDDYRLGNDGQLASITAGTCRVTVSLVVVLNADGLAIRKKYTDAVLANVELRFISASEVSSGVPYRADIKMPKVQLTTAEIGTDETAMRISCDGSAFWDATAQSPITIELTNKRATAY